MYLFIRWLCKAIVRSFFRELSVINYERIPLYGPVIFVGNHNNQFMDASLLIEVLPRRVRFLMAEKSMRRKIVGNLAKFAGCISVKRQVDTSYESIGKIFWNFSPHIQEIRKKDIQINSTPRQRKPIEGNDIIETTVALDNQEESTIIRGIGTRFLIDLKKGYRMTARNETPMVATVKRIVSDTILIVDENIAVECSDTDKGVSFSVQPKVDQTEVYDAVSESLKDGDTIGVFPEGGSHDRTTLLPLKPGVAVMALCSVLEGAEDVMIVPIGLSYHQVDKFQSKATVEIGVPIPVTEEMAALYDVDRRAAAGKLLAQVEEGLRNCVLTAPDYSTMKCIRLCSSLFPPERLRLALDRYHGLHHRFSKIFWKYGEEKHMVGVKAKLRAYEKSLKRYAILDSEVWHLKQSTAGASLALVEKIYSLLICVIMGLPLSILWGPLGIVAYWLAERHRVVALAGSSVKIKATDVLASYKISVLIILLPTVNALYGMIFGSIYFDNWTSVFMTILFCVCVLPYLYYMSIQKVDNILPLCRQIKILIFVITGKINVWRDTERQLIIDRIEAQILVRNIVQDFGPKVSPSFLDEFYEFVPKMVLQSDTRRLMQKKEEWSPIAIKKYHESREEIL